MESAREVYGSLTVGEKNPKSVWWNDEIKAAVRRKKTVWREVLAASDEEAKERCMEVYTEEKKKVRRCIYLSKQKVNDLDLDWFWRLLNMAFQSGVVSEDWRSTVIVSLCKGKGERTEC